MKLLFRPFRVLVKTCCLAVFVSICFPLLALAQANNPVTSAAATIEAVPYAVAARGPNGRFWQRVMTQTNSLGQTIYHTNSYQELATGLCFWNGSQWVDASDQIQLTQNGAAATNTQHQVAFAANLNTAGAINLTTPDGRQMASQVLGLSYFDSGASNNVLFATTQDSIGQLLPSGNQVIYTNAFTNADCDVLYTHRLNGFEQDIVIRQQLPSPASCGLTGSNIWLQVWTEFTAAPTPRITQPQAGGDAFLDFGTMKMGRGKAFMLGSPTNSVPVIKEWVTSEGRTFLVESVFLNSIVAKIAALPSSSGSSGNSNPVPGSGSSGTGEQSKIRSPQPPLAFLAPPHPNFKTLKLPPPQLAKHTSASMRLASASPSVSGFVLDYNLINGSQTNFTFQSDTTYFITNEVDLYGTTTIEGGTVIKYSANGTETIVPSDLVWKTGPYRPAIFTGQDDDSVGQQISGSTGDPTETYYGFIALNLASGDTALVSNARFSFLNAAVAVNNYYGDGIMRDVQFNQCQTVMAGDSQGIDGTHNFDFYNVLAWNIGTFIGFDGDYGGQSVLCQNCTVDGCSQFFVDYTSIVNLYNSICASVGWNAYAVNNNYSAVLGDDSGVFQSVGAGNFYLAPGTYQGQGTSSIDSTLLADLSQRTTYPPIVLSNILVSSNTVLAPQAIRDTSGSPDLGYHYDPLDYIADYYMVTNATLTLTNGVAIACFDDELGIWLQDGSAIVSIGTPTAPNWFTTYQAVQEQAVTIGTGGSSPCYVESYPYGATGANGTFQFTRFSGGSGNMLENVSPYWAYNTLLIADCEFWAGACAFNGSTNSGATTVIDNSLFVRSQPNVTMNSSGNLAFSNNLVWCAQFDFHIPASCTCYAFNNIFDTCSIFPGHGSTSSNGYNAYLNTTGQLSPTNGYDIVTNTSLAYLSGPFGTFYQPTNSPLLNMGSTNANLLGLYEYTTQTNEVKEATNIVTIGYHYVAADTNGNPDSTLWLGIPDYLVDTNNDGDPNLVSWQMEYFGYTGLNPNSDPFNEGTTLLQDYQSSNDLTLIAFTLNITNNYISTTNSPVTLAVSQGIPQYLAVLVDNTNLSSATWTNYSSNVVVNVGTNQGWHDVWIGLSALPTNAVPVWQWNRLKLELTPPVLVITNPAVSTVSVPLVQVQGYSPEELNSVHYDLTNAAGVWTNLPGGISGQVYSTNTCEFTTNYFQCVDVFLTNGSNLITVHAADMAGNLATTNVSIVLDYSTRTNPPAVSLFWPQDGTLICNTNYTWRGWVDDPTATVTAQAVDTNGNTNIFNAIVERDGNFWVENMSLYCTNYLTLTVTDSAGNVATTNITISPSPVTITINTPNSNSLWLPPLTLTGTISDSTDYTLWLNGTKATLNGDGTWTATNVYLPTGGTALFQARAIPNTDNGGNGTGGGGGGTNTSYASVGNPNAASSPNDLESQVDKPPRLYVQMYQHPTDNLNYNYSLTLTATNDGSLLEYDTDQAKAVYNVNNWTDGQGGSGSQSDYDLSTDDGSTNLLQNSSQQTWPASSWPTLLDGTQTYTGDEGPDADTNTGPPTIIFEHCVLQWPINQQWNHVLAWLGGEGDGPDFAYSTGYRTGSYTRSADVQVMLQTGGKSGSSRQNLFQFSASANENYPSPGYVNSPDTLFVNMPILSQTIQIMGKNLGADGYLYTTLPDNISQDVTPQVPGVNYYTFLEGIGKYHPSITVSTSTVTANLDDTTPEICVGQQVTFTLGWDSTPPNVVGADTLQGWTLPAKYVNQPFYYSTASSPACQSYTINNAFLGNNPTYCWYVNKPGGTVSVWQSLHFTNGQYASVAASGSITIFRPTVTAALDAGTTPSFFAGYNYSLPGIKLGGDGDPRSGGHAMAYDVTYDTTSDNSGIVYTGTGSIAQLIGNANFKGTPSKTFSDWRLDGNTVAYESATINPDHYPPQTVVPFQDTPNNYWFSPVWLRASFQDYCMFQPDGENSIPVTLGVVTWSCDGACSTASGTNTVTKDQVTGPNGPDESDAFPLWLLDCPE